MVFLNSWAMVLGLIGMGWLILIHYITRPRPRQLPLSTLRFVKEVTQQQSSLHRLRRWFIFSLRFLTLLFITLTFARPQFPAQSRKALKADVSVDASATVQAPTELNYVLITREQTASYPSSSYYLEQALTLAQPDNQSLNINLLRTSPSQIDHHTAMGSDLIVVDHPGILSNDTMDLLSSYIRSGKAILYIASETEDTANLTRFLQTCTSHLQLPVRFKPVPEEQRRNNLFLANVRKDSPPFAIFNHHTYQEIHNLKFSIAITAHTMTNEAEDMIWATYSNQTACLLVLKGQAGVLAVLNADLGYSELPKSPVFVPMIGELVSFLINEQTNFRNEINPQTSMTGIADADRAGHELTGTHSESNIWAWFAVACLACMLVEVLILKVIRS